MADDEADVLKPAIELAKQADSFAAFAVVESTGEATEIVDRYRKLTGVFYGQEKSVTRMIEFGRAGIGYALHEARRIEKTDKKQADKLKGMAKTISYNVSANSWPAWEDKGITITDSDLANGFDLAKLNLRLAKELDRSAEVFGNAHWLVGAHHLAAKRTNEAVKSFQESAEQFNKAKKPDFALMATGYHGLARALSKQDADAGEKAFREAVSDLKKLDTEDSKFFASQLESVRKFFEK